MISRSVTDTPWTHLVAFPNRLFLREVRRPLHIHPTILEPGIWLQDDGNFGRQIFAPQSKRLLM
jgi:hypothetical protein